MTKINVSLKPYLTNNRRLPTKLMEGLTIHLGSKKKKTEQGNNGQSSRTTSRNDVITYSIQLLIKLYYMH